MASSWGMNLVKGLGDQVNQLVQELNEEPEDEEDVLYARIADLERMHELMTDRLEAEERASEDAREALVASEEKYQMLLKKVKYLYCMKNLTC